MKKKIEFVLKDATVGSTRTLTTTIDERLYTAVQSDRKSSWLVSYPEGDFERYGTVAEIRAEIARIAQRLRESDNAE